LARVRETRKPRKTSPPIETRGGGTTSRAHKGLVEGPRPQPKNESKERASTEDDKTGLQGAHLPQAWTRIVE